MIIYIRHTKISSSIKYKKRSLRLDKSKTELYKIKKAIKNLNKSIGVRVCDGINKTMDVTVDTIDSAINKYKK